MINQYQLSSLYQGDDHQKHDRKTLFDAIADYNPEIKVLHNELLTSKLAAEDKDHLKSGIIAGMACQFTINDIRAFFIEGFRDDYPSEIQSKTWENRTSLGQHNWSSCKAVVDAIEKGLSNNQ